MTNQMSPRNNLKNVSKTFVPNQIPAQNNSPHISPRNTQVQPPSQPDRTSFDFGFDSAPKTSPKQSPKANPAAFSNMDFNFLDQNPSGPSMSPKMAQNQPMQGSKDNSLDNSGFSGKKVSEPMMAKPQGLPPGTPQGPPPIRQGPPPGMALGGPMPAALPDMSGLQAENSQRLMGLANAHGNDLKMRVAAREQEIKALSLLNE
jgi:hypothetical protein